MAERSYNGRVINTNPTMTGTGSTTTVNSWIGDSSQGWGVVQTTSGAIASCQYTTYLDEDCIQLSVTGLTRSGGTLGSVAIANTSSYPGGTLSPSVLSGIVESVQPRKQYKISARYFISALAADTGSVRFTVSRTWYDSNGTRLSITDSTPDTTISTAWESYEETVTAPVRAAYLIFRANLFPNQDPTTNGSGTVYVSDFRVTEVLPARTTATSRSTATNRVAVRDMGTALRFGAADTDRVVIENSAGEVYDNVSDMTLAFTFKASAFGDYYLFSIPATAGVNRKYVLLTSSKAISVNIGAGGLGTIFTNTIPNEWYTVMVMFDHTNSRAKAFVNGQESKGWTAVTYGTGNADISLCSISNTKALRGIADEFRMFPRILSDQEASDYYYNNVVQGEKLGEYLFDEASGTTALDTSGNGNHGTITGATYTTDTPLRPRTSV